MSDSFNHVLVHGIHTPKPILRVQNARFTDQIKQNHVWHLSSETHMTNTDLYRMTDEHLISKIILECQLQFTRHCLQMPKDEPANIYVIYQSKIMQSNCCANSGLTYLDKISKYLSTDKTVRFLGEEIANYAKDKQLWSPWMNNNFTSPTLVQSYAWPIINLGCHVTVVSPKNTGKPIAYMYPLLKSLSDDRMYRELSSGLGPYVIILTKTWRQAESVYLAFINAMNDENLRILLVHGGGQEENKAITLLNGCEILVTTPPSLKRILHSQYTDLRRLAHLVIDDADQLLQVFTKEIINIMEQYLIAMKFQKKNVESPRQILLLASQWNDAIRSFMEAFLVKPVLIITSPFEASIYGKVKQELHIVLKDQRLQTVLRIVETIEKRNSAKDERTVIFASNREDIEMLYKTLHGLSYSCSMVHDGMNLYEVHQVMKGWPLGLLVSCDAYFTEINITDATNVIHYDIANSKKKFSNRFGCMLKYFYDFSKMEQFSAEPTSHIIITECCEDVHLKVINELLERSNCIRPSKWSDFLSRRLLACEGDAEKELCTQLLAYGKCTDKLTWRCPYRHSIIPEVDNAADAEWLPEEGEVKVLVTQIIDANRYYVRVLSVRNEDKSTRDLSPVYCHILMELAIWYSNPSNCKRYVDPCMGDLCGYQENELYYRVQILNCINNDDQDEVSAPIEVEVKFVDSGRTDYIHVNKLYLLPEKLQEMPFQAVEVYTCNVQPVDKDPDWTPKAITFINESLHGMTLNGKIVLRLGYKMWLDPLVIRVHLGESNSVVNQFYVHTELMGKGLADENPNHLKELQNLFEGKVKVPKALLVKTKISPKLDTDVLLAENKVHKAFVSSIKSPELFFLQRKDKIDNLEDMMKEINTYITENEEEGIVHEIEVGKYCLAQYTNFDNRWYRCRILAVNEDSYSLFFADYGDQGIISKDKIRRMPVDKFYELPLQAIECKLNGIASLASESHEDKVGDVMWDLTHFVNNDMRPCLVTVHETLYAEFAGSQKYVVDLVCAMEKQKLNIAVELLWKHLVIPTDNSIFKPLFKKMDVSMMEYSSPLEKVAHICAQIYWKQEQSEALCLAEEICSIFSNNLLKILNSVLEETAVEGLKCMVKLIGHVQWASVHKVILDCLLCLARSGERFCQELIQEDCMLSILLSLEMNSDQDIQCQAAEFIAQLVQLSSRVKSCFEADENIRVLMELFESTECLQVLGAVCRAFAALCCGTESVYAYLAKHSLCQKLVECLRQSSHHQVSEGALILLLALAEHDRSNKYLKRESLIEAIVTNLERTDCNKCIHISVQLCNSFAALRRKHKTFLLEHQIVQILKRILELNLQPTTKQMCVDMMTALVIKVPSQPLEGLAIKGDNIEHHIFSNNGGPPKIHWVQNRYIVKLHVNVSGVKGLPKDIVTFTKNSVAFRANMNGAVCAFSYKLFDNINVDMSQVEIKAHQVLIILKKSKEGRWSRLLYDKYKPPNLSVDFESFADSSSDSEAEDADGTVRLRKKTKGFANRPTEAVVTLPVTNDETDTDDSLENLEDSDDIDEFDELS